jgi:type VI secretion system protein ImpF
MAELVPGERLQPVLLDRLTDLDPECREEGRDKRIMSLQQLRQSVVRDLGWLLNSTSLDVHVDMQAYPHARRSVLNYGLASVSGVTVSGMDAPGLERKLLQAILNFEPRLQPDTLRTRVAVAEEQMNNHAVCFNIEADLWAQPLPLHLYIRTAIEFDTGKVHVQDAGG